MPPSAEQPDTPSETRGSCPRTSIAGWLLAIGFFVVASGLIASPRLATIPITPSPPVDRSLLTVGPRRTPMSDPPRITVEGREQSCRGCHQIFTSSHAAGTTPNYHGDVRLSHGLNNRCVNCHDASDRERLTLRDGETVPFTQTPRLCSQCHGTVFRDWERGTHGKTLGSWVTGSDAQRRLNCNECHDPHSPRYPPMMPLPGPTTLRMGHQETEVGHESRSPLQQWLRPDAEGKEAHR